MSVIASFLVGRNGASTLGGLSAPLSTPEDRNRFLARHRSAGAFIIGKNSATIESYAAARVPIYVLTRNGGDLHLPHPLMQQIIIDSDLAVLTRRLDQMTDGDLVIEAGARLLLALAHEGVIDLLELSQTEIDGDGDFLDIDDLLSCFTIVEVEVVNGTRLLKCRNESDATDC